MARERARWEIRLGGVVQGVGFRPWAARWAGRLGLAGSVRNTAGGVCVALEGAPEAIEAWLAALASEPPAGARIEAVRTVALPPLGESGFRIEASRESDLASTPIRVAPDVPVCEACLAELFDPRDRRYRYPFTHCTGCGPRACVIVALPYDRERTSLRAFPLCERCRAEYRDPGNRRYHAQTIACPACGPRLRLLTPEGEGLAGDPIETAAAWIGSGALVAVKGYGGFHLVGDATSEEVVARLRKRKGRPAKPFAVLVPNRESARRLIDLDPAAERLLAPPTCAVVVAPRREREASAVGIAPGVAPRTRDLGLILPYTPLHWLLLYPPGAHPGTDPPRFRALILTSANRSEEPTVSSFAEARDRLRGIADLVLDHDREVARPNDDPVFRSGPRGPIPLRLSRSTAPRVLALPAFARRAPPLLAVGGDLKCAPALARAGEVVLAEHVGDLACVEALDALERRLRDLGRLLGIEPEVVAHDLHPDYMGTRLAGGLGLRNVPVQHHHAHAVSCLVDQEVEPPALAWVLDGAGYGPDGTVWGGELLDVGYERFDRLAHLEAVPLPGGDAAAREPWRMAAVWLRRAFPAGEAPPPLAWHERRDPQRLARLLELAERPRLAPVTSSCGRLFDALASLLDQGDRVSHEGEAALALEALAEAGRRAGRRERALPPRAFPGEARRVVPVADLVRAIVLRRAAGEGREPLARSFHRELARRLAAAAAAWAARLGRRRIVMSGGCFQNRILLDDLGSELERLGLESVVHERIPPHDGGLAVGQAAVAAARLVLESDARAARDLPQARRA